MGKRNGKWGWWFVIYKDKRGKEIFKDLKIIVEVGFIFVKLIRILNYRFKWLWVINCIRFYVSKNFFKME